MINRTILVGRLTKDPELRYTPNGVAVSTFTLAVNRTYTNSQGEREADFINCVAWRKQAENIANYLRKGSLAGVDGRLQTRSYETKDGRRVYVTEVICESVQFLEPKRVTESNADNTATNNFQGFSGQSQQTNASFSQDPFFDNSEPVDISDDDLPF